MLMDYTKYDPGEAFRCECGEVVQPIFRVDEGGSSSTCPRCEFTVTVMRPKLVRRPERMPQ